MKFSELGLLPVLEEALLKENITVPTPIQVESAPTLLEGKDAYISSETGTGKTLAFLLPLFCKIDPAQKSVQTIVLAPTHELALQVQEQATRLAKDSGLPIRSQVIIGSASTKRQLENLKKKPHIVIGSSGRILELIKMKKLKVHNVKTIVIDEVDRLLYGDSLGFIKSIVKSTLRDRQLVFVSATEQRESMVEVEKLSPKVVKIHTACNTVSTSIEHLSFLCEERDKPDLLRKLIHALEPERAIVFVHKNESAETIAAKLAHHKLPVADIHGSHDKNKRKQALKEFRSGKAKILISSDVTARGLDIKGVTHVFNFDLPAQSSAYLHRVGRTGRAGAQGHAILLLTKAETRLCRRYQKELGIEITPSEIHGGKVYPLDI